MIVFSCGQCGAPYSVEPRLCGKVARCRSCGTAMQIPYPAAAPAAAPPRNPLGLSHNPLGLNVDWDAMDLSAPAGPVLGGVTARKQRAVKRGGSGNGALWLLLGGMGLGGAVLAAIAMIAIAALDWGSSARNEAAAYLPANWTSAISIRPAELIDRVSGYANAKSLIEMLLVQASAEGVDLRNLDEMLVVTEGRGSCFVCIFDRAVDLGQSFRSAVAADSHQGLTIYSQRPPGNREAVYLVSPKPKLILGSSDLARLKAALDQAADRRPSASDLPSGSHLMMRVRDMSAPEATSYGRYFQKDEVRSTTASFHLSSNLSINLSVDFKDAQTAAAYEKRISDAYRELQRSRSQSSVFHYSSAWPDNVRISASGSQVRISGSIPAARLNDGLSAFSAFARNPAFGGHNAPRMPGAPQQGTGVPR